MTLIEPEMIGSVDETSDDAHQEIDVRAALFSGGGEMGERMRAFDWSATPLGPVDTWPQSLKTCMRIMLTSRQPIWIGWGEELIYMYNDPYKAIIGGKHPHALGQPASVVWRDIWSVIEPMLAQAMHGDEGTYVEAARLIMNRNGYDEETYYTFSYSPVPNDDGGGTTGGIICANTDDTHRVIGERQMTLLRELAATGTDAREVEDAGRHAARALETNALDLPFALIYLTDPQVKNTLVLSGAAGVPGPHALAPRTIVEGDDAPWPTAALFASPREMRVVDCPRAAAPTPRGAWEREPSRVAIVPIAQAGDHGRSGVVIVGLNPFRELDDDYRRFLHLVASQISASIASAEAYQEERKRAETLAELDRAKTAFFSNVSHEFRTPLALMLGPSEDALADETTTPANRERLAIVHRNALRLLKLVNSLLDFSRIEAGRVQASYEATDLAAYTAELASSFRSAVERAGLRLEVDARPLPAPVYVDCDMWEKVVLNLLSNAFKHTFHGEIRVTIGARDGCAVVEFRDTGVGIPAEQLAHLFERFHRVPNARSRTHEGTGIGLALVQELVKQHGGDIRVSSEVGTGSTFTISIPFGTSHLPAERIAPSANRRTSQPFAQPFAAPFIEEALRWLPATGQTPPEPTGEHAAATASANGSSVPAGNAGAPTVSGRVLVADDNADMRIYLTRLLRERGWDVDAVTNGRAALEFARANHPDVVLSDVMMPELDGYALLAALRSEEQTRAIPVILLSARAGEEARIEGLRAGADDYLVKPFAARELVSRVESQLRHGRDIAEQRRRKEEQDRLFAAVEKERSHFRELFAKAPAAIAVLQGPNHVFELANPHYLSLVGHRPVVGKPIREALPELEHQGIFELLDDVYRTGTPFVGEQYAVQVDADGDGEPEDHFYNFVYQPMEEDGRVTGIFIHAIEVSDLVRSRKAAESANKAKSEFLAAMSHELRTPLNAIAGHAQLLEMGIHGPLTTAQHEAVERIRRSEDHLLALINDVLNFAKLEAGRIVYDIDEVALSDIASDVLTIVQPLLEAKHLAYETKIDPAIRVRADGEKVKQILVNLLSNAIKFTDAGGRITVETTRRGQSEVDGMAALRVSDTGIGIPRDRQESIFDPFVQVHRNLTRNTEGTGLGLAISRDLARGMGGDLRVRSTEGEGSSFTLTLPRVANG